VKKFVEELNSGAKISFCVNLCNLVYHIHRPNCYVFVGMLEEVKICYFVSNGLTLQFTDDSRLSVMRVHV